MSKGKIALLGKRGIFMTECSCSIFNTREERIIEDDGRILRRLICNICGRVLDSKEEFEQGVKGADGQPSEKAGQEGETFGF